MAGDIKVPIPSLPEADKVLKTDQIIFQGSTKTQRCTLTKLLTDLRIANPDMNPDDVLGMIIPNNAGAHNSIYRGKNLGTRVTEAQWAEIKAGTFRDLFIGDYWTISGVIWRIAAFDYYYNTGDTPCRTHHITLVPDAILYSYAMNDTNTTNGGYVGSKMYKEGLTQAKNYINTAFGEAHILKHRRYLCNAVTSGRPSGGAWYDSTVELMTEQTVYGGRIFGVGNSSTTIPDLYLRSGAALTDNGSGCALWCPLPILPVFSERCLQATATLLAPVACAPRFRLSVEKGVKTSEI